MAVLTGFILGLILPMVAAASSSDHIRALIAAGDYEQARILATNMDTAEGYILASQSLSTQIMLGEVLKLNERSKDARELAKMALILDPASYDAKLQYALTDGFVTRTTGNLTAWRKKLPMKTQDAIKALRADYPNDARAMALDAAWHFGIIRKAGENAGLKWFGASADEGRQLYEQAIEIAPHDMVIRINYVAGLLVLKSDPNITELKAQLEDIMLITPKTDVETKVKDRAIRLYINLENKSARENLAERFLDGK